MQAKLEDSNPFCVFNDYLDISSGGKKSFTYVFKFKNKMGAKVEYSFKSKLYKITPLIYGDEYYFDENLKRKPSKSTYYIKDVLDYLEEMRTY